jgi:glyoxylase-like metal-dependent hydrolase (beta-lactamase superfamily II)
MLTELPTLVCRIPDLTIDAHIAIHGTRRIAEVHVPGPGHTESDLYIELADDGVVFCGDLAFFGCQPFMFDASPEPWVEWIRRMEASPYEVFVPGHGPVGGKKELALLRQFITTLVDLVRAVAQRGDPVDRALEIRLPDPFAAWQAASPGRFQVNVRALYEWATRSA